MSERPTAAELVEAVAEFLERDIVDADGDELSGRVRFHARVAVNALGMVERELALGPALDEAEMQRLRGLFGDLHPDSDLDTLRHALAAGVRDGSLDDRRDAIVEHIRETLRGKLEISKPGYADAISSDDAT